jgi:hypothetical protein
MARSRGTVIGLARRSKQLPARLVMAKRVLLWDGLQATVVAGAAVADFNNDGHPDYVLHSPSTRQTAIWYLNNNVFISGALGPSIMAGWLLDGVADFNRDTHPD